MSGAPSDQPSSAPSAPPSAPLPSPSALSPFRNRLFAAYWLTGLSANFGWLIQTVGASWLMISIGGTADMVALVQTTLALPLMFFSLFAGALSDTIGRRKLIIWSQSFLLIVSILLAVITYIGWITPWILLLFTFVIGTGKALNNPAWQTYVSDILPREEIPQAVSLNSMGFNLARSVGPAIGGAIVATVGAFAAFLVSAISNIGMILVMWKRQDVKVEHDLPPEPIGRAMMAGLRYVAMSPNILLVILRATIFNFTAIIILALLPLVARDLIGGGPQTFGLLLGAFGIGAVISVLAARPLLSRITLEASTRIGFIVFALATAVIGYSSWQILTLIACGFAGAAWVLTFSTFNSKVQISSPRWVVSRCLALYQTASFAGNALGSWLWGIIAHHYGTESALYIAAIAILMGAAVGLWLPLRDVGKMNLDPSLRWVAPEVKLDVQPRSGPVVTVIEFEIEESDVKSFLAAMAERRRTRYRDGARHWSLERDLINPRLWIERYETPTWVETLRHHQRRTMDDRELTDIILALHRGEERPKVRYLINRQPSALQREPSFHNGSHHQIGHHN